MLLISSDSLAKPRHLRQLLGILPQLLHLADYAGQRMLAL